MRATAGEKISQIVLSQVNGAVDSCRSKMDYEALGRLLSHASAVRAWEMLFARVKTDGLFIAIVAAVADLTARSTVNPRERRTKAQIVAAAEKASSLARDLARLILENPSLRIEGAKLLHPRQIAARAWVLKGLQLSGLQFTDDVEAKLQRIRFASADHHTSTMSTNIAHDILADETVSNIQFASRLIRFAYAAQGTAKLPPISSHPTSKKLSQRLYSVAVCKLLNDQLGTPCVEIAANLADAVFNSGDTDGETVKKWWQRARDKSPNDD